MSKVFIIAEVGVNHNGSVDIAKKLIKIAAEAGADAVKFQTFKADKIASTTVPKADYQQKNAPESGSQLEMLSRLELDASAHEELIYSCRRNGIQFLSTPFDFESLDLLANTFDLQMIKLSSGEINNAPLLLAAARTGKTIIMSTGMSTLGEIETALGVLAFGYIHPTALPSRQAFVETYCSLAGQQALQNKVSLLHCTTEYPAPFEEVNLAALDTLKTAFGLQAGFSDHTPGIAIPIAAVARGAAIIEKHFTLDKNLPGPDHRASLEPQELKEMVRSIRQVEAAMGTGRKYPMPAEKKNKAIARKSLVAAQVIKKGERFTENNLAAKRAGEGISPLYYWDWLGKYACRDYKKDEAIDP